LGLGTWELGVEALDPGYFRQRIRGLSDRRWAGLVIVVLVAVLAWGAAAAAPPAGGTPRREDHGDLIVLYVYGSYYDMGRQQAQLLGPVAHRMYEYHLEKYRRHMAAGGANLWAIDLGARALPIVGPWYEDSGFFEEMNGVADGLGVPRTDLLRAVMASSFGSTVFAATRSATADGGALIGRNVDWDDGNGIMRPVLVLAHPNTGDLPYILGGWPLIGLPAIGMNAAGFALSFNFFITDEFMGIPPKMRDRRALQTARTVADGERVFTDVRKRAMPTFMVMADATGDIAMLECTPSACATFRPDGDWFAQANHARTPEMIPLDRYRSPDSFARLAAMEAAVRPHVGALTPVVASQILRDRSNTPYVNDASVGNVFVLNAAVLHPASKTLWHAVTMEPEAPFGSYLPFSVGANVSATPPLPADARVGTPPFADEQAILGRARLAVRQYEAGNTSGAGLLWDQLAADESGTLHPDRLAYGRAVAQWRQGNAAAVDPLIGSIDPQRAPFDVRVAALLARAVVNDERGQREAALSGYRETLAVLDGAPQYTDTGTEAFRRHARAGLAGPLSRAAVEPIPHLQYLPE